MMVSDMTLNEKNELLATLWGDQSVTLQNLQQLVHRGARNAELASERGGLRLTIARDELEDVERTVGRRSQRDTWRG